GADFLILVDPGTLLADVGDLHHVGVEPGLFRGLAEGGLVHARRAGTHHDAGQAVFRDGFADLLLADLGTHILIIRGVDDARNVLHGLGNRVYVHRARDVASAPANKDADFLHSRISPLFAVLAQG